MTWLDLQGLPADVLSQAQPTEQWMADLARTPVERLGLRAESSIRRGDLASALDYLDAARDQESNDPRLDAIAGAAAFAGGDLLGALKQFDRAIAGGLQTHVIHVERAQALHGLGRHREAHEALSSALRLNEDQPTLSLRAVVAQVMGRDTEAEADFSRAIQLDPEHFAVWAQRGSSRGNRRLFAEAEVDFTRAIELLGSAAGELRVPDVDQRGGIESTLRQDRATARVALGDYPGALSDLDAIVRLRPDQAQPYLSRGMFRQMRRAHAKAVADFTRALEHEPEHPLALVARAQSRIQLRDYDTALEEMERLRESRPGDPISARSRIYALIGIGRLDEARWEIQELPDGPSEAVDNACLRALLERHAGDHDAASGALETAFRRLPGHPWICNSLAWFLATCPDASRRDPERALRLIRRARSTHPEPRAEILDTEAAALAAAGQFELAVEVQRLAIELLDSDAIDARISYQSRLGLYRSGRPYQSHDPADD